MTFDVNNIFYQLLLALGCDLNSNLTSFSDYFKLGLAFIFGVVVLFVFLKFLYTCMRNLFRGGHI